MNEAEREHLNGLNAELMVLIADYEDLKKGLLKFGWKADYKDLKKRLLKLGRKIFKFKVKIDDKLNGGTK